MKYRNKTFLNDSHEETGFIVWHVNPYNSFFYGDKNSYEASILIGDCSNTINLCFDFKNKSELEKRIQKVQVIKDQIIQFEEALVSARSLYNKKFYY
jgi:hypothetical protein